MFFTLDLDRNLLVQSAGSEARTTRAEAKRSEAGPVVIEVVQGGVVATAAISGLLLKTIAKPVKKYDGDPLAETTAFAWSAAVGAYVAAINWITEGLDPLFFVDGNPENDVASLPLALGVAHRFAADAPWKESENDVALTLRNNYVRDTDGTPLALPGPEEWLDARAVRYDEAQALTSGERKQARDNLGIHDFITLALSDLVSDLSTGTAKAYFRMPYAATVTAVRASVIEAPDATIVVDVNESGSTILSTKLSIDSGEKTSTTAASQAAISDAALADDAEITIDIDQVGISTPGKGLIVTIYFIKTNP